MTKGTKLSVCNITAKVALQFGNEVWVLKKRDGKRLETAHEILRHLIGITKIQ
jgi:hypothetical protein